MKKWTEKRNNNNNRYMRTVEGEREENGLPECLKTSFIIQKRKDEAISRREEHQRRCRLFIIIIISTHQNLKHENPNESCRRKCLRTFASARAIHNIVNHWRLANNACLQCLTMYASTGTIRWGVQRKFRSRIYLNELLMIQNPPLNVFRSKKWIC